MIFNYKVIKKLLLGSPRVKASILVVSFFSVTKRRFSSVSFPLKFSQGKLPFVRYKRIFASPSRSSLRLYSKSLDVITYIHTEQAI